MKIFKKIRNFFYKAWCNRCKRFTEHVDDGSISGFCLECEVYK